MQMSNFFERLKEERERLGFNQEAFGAIGGVKKLAQFNYEKGERKPDSDYLAAISRVGVDVLYLLTGKRTDATVTGEEELLLKGFRLMDAETKRRTLAMVYGGTPPAPSTTKFNVQGNVENQFESNYGNINIDKRGKK